MSEGGVSTEGAATGAGWKRLEMPIERRIRPGAEVIVQRTNGKREGEWFVAEEPAEGADKLLVCHFDEKAGPVKKTISREDLIRDNTDLETRKPGSITTSLDVLQKALPINSPVQIITGGEYDQTWKVAYIGELNSVVAREITGRNGDMETKRVPTNVLYALNRRPEST